MQRSIRRSRGSGAILLALTLGGCVVQAAPAPYASPAPYAQGGYAAGGYEGPAAYAPPPNVVYVRPAYASPGAGYIWRYHRHFGWGWWHPQYGWHRHWVGY